MCKQSAPLLIGMALTVLLSLVLPSAMGSMGTGTQDYDLDEIELRLTSGGYIETLWNALWTVEQGESIIPHIDLLLTKLDRQEIDEMSAGAFPFNAIWALAQIGGDKAYHVLIKYNRSMATALAIEALEARKQDPSLRVLGSAKTLYRLPSYQSRAIAQLEEGCRVVVLSERVLNHNEEGGRGGPAMFDYVLVPDRQLRGYIMRAGDGFPPYY